MLSITFPSTTPSNCNSTSTSATSSKDPSRASPSLEQQAAVAAAWERIAMLLSALAAVRDKVGTSWQELRPFASWVLAHVCLSGTDRTAALADGSTPSAGTTLIAGPHILDTVDILHNAAMSLILHNALPWAAQLCLWRSVC